jgi:rRNA maturation protein Nop10
MTLPFTVVVLEVKPPAFSPEDKCHMLRTQSSRRKGV